MPKYNIIASDLDGTLLDDEGFISQENKKAIAELVDMGVYFVPCTGRTYGELPDCIRDEPLVRYIIYSDGAGIYDKATGEKIKTYMSKENSLRALELFESYDTIITTRVDGVSYVDADRNNDEEYAHSRMSDKYRDFVYICNVPVKDYKRFCREAGEVEMFCTFFANDDEMAECKRILEATGEYVVASSERFNLEVFSINAGKGRALLRLAEHLGVDKEKTIGVGDSTNDMNMIELAGLGLAVDNAFDELKAAADEVICSYREHSIKYILENYVK